MPNLLRWLRTRLRHATPHHRAQTKAYALALGYADWEMRPYADAFIAHGWSPTLVNVISNYSMLFRLDPQRVVDLASRISGAALDTWMPYLIWCKIDGLHPAFPHASEPDWDDSALAPAWPAQMLLGHPEWVAELADWHDAAGPLAPLAHAAGLSLEEARSGAGDGTLDEEGLRTLIALRGARWEESGIDWKPAAV